MPIRVPAPISISAEAQNMLADAQPMDLPALSQRRKDTYDFSAPEGAKTVRDLSGITFRALLFGAFSFCIACTPVVPPENIAPHEQEAFLVLADQMDKLDLEKNQERTPLCVSVSVDNQNKPISLELMAALRSAMPDNLNAEIVDGSTCHKNTYGQSISKDGTRGLHFFAAREQRAEPTWRAGWVWESLWGGGELYKIQKKGNRMIAEEVGQWNT